MFSQTSVSFCDCSLIQAIIFVFPPPHLSSLDMLTACVAYIATQQLFQDPKEIFLSGFSKH